MRKIQLFNHKDLMRLGFIISDPDQEDLLLESVNNEYIRRINRLLPRYWIIIKKEREKEVRGDEYWGT